MTQVKLGKYEHFKGGLCDVLGVAKDSENLEEFVVYVHHDPVKGEKGKSMWIRPKKMFLENVIVGSKKVPRFKFIK